MLVSNTHSGWAPTAWTWAQARSGVIPSMISPLDEASQVDADAVAWPTTFLRCGDTDVCQRVHARILELTQIYTHTAGMAGIYAACALLRLATNVPAELWVPANDEQ